MKKTFVESPWPPAPLRAARAHDAIHVAVDLSHIRPGGENGGVKPFIFEYLREIVRQEGSSFVFTYLTWSISHVEVRQLARPQDQLVCVRAETSDDMEAIANWRSGEWVELKPPVDFLHQLAVQVLYAPLGSAEFACPGIPVIATIVDLLHRDYPHTLTTADVGARERHFTELVARVDRFQCISEHTGGRLQLHYGVEPSRVFCTHIVIQNRLDIPGGVSPMSAGQPYFLFPANAWEHKNHLTLLVAYRRYRQFRGNTAWKLVLTGHDSPRMQDVLAAASALNLARDVVFFGHLATPEFAALWRGASALLFPSLHEGFGIPLLEAMHFGVPVLCGNEGSMPEVGGGAALYVDARQPFELAAAMERLTAEFPLREKLIAAGKKRLDEFQLAGEVQEFVAQLKSLATKTGLIWNRGVHPDGWMEKRAIFALPSNALERRIHIRVPTLPAPRRLRFYHGHRPLGGFSMSGVTPETIELCVGPGESPLVLECPDAENLNPQDHRNHGVVLAGIDVHAGSHVHPLL